MSITTTNTPHSGNFTNITLQIGWLTWAGFASVFIAVWYEF